MKDFIINKFLEYDDEVLGEFHSKMIGPLPLYASPSSFSEHIFTWGSVAEGEWSVNLNEGRFFENNGTIHIVGRLRDREYYNIHTDLYKASLLRDLYTDTDICNISKPIECQEIAFNRRIDYEKIWHPSGIVYGTRIHYIKLQTPSNGYGIPFELERLIDPNFDVRQYLKDYVDQMTWIIKVLKALGHPLTVLDEAASRLRYSDGFMLTVLPAFTMSVQDGIAKNLEFIKGLSDHFPLGEDILQYARDKWLPLAN